MEESLPMNKFDSIYWHFYYRYFYELTNSSYACVMESNLKKKKNKPKPKVICFNTCGRESSDVTWSTVEITFLHTSFTMLWVHKVALQLLFFTISKLMSGLADQPLMLFPEINAIIVN